MAQIILKLILGNDANPGKIGVDLARLTGPLSARPPLPFSVHGLLKNSVGVAASFLPSAATAEKGAGRTARRKGAPDMMSTSEGGHGKADVVREVALIL